MKEEIKQKDWKEEFIKQYCYQKLPDETEYVLRPISGDRMLNIIQGIISQALQKRDEQIYKIIDKVKQELLDNQNTTSRSLEHHEHIVSMVTIAKLEGEFKRKIINSNN